MDIVLTADHDYIMQLCVTMYSIIKNVSKDLKVTYHVFLSDYTTFDINDIEKIKQCGNCEIIYYNINKYLYLFEKVDQKTFKNSYINLVCYYRLLIPIILPESVKKCFYIDCDIIVDTDISVLYNQFNDSSVLGAVVESYAMSKKTVILKHLKDIHYFYNFSKNPTEYPYFNAGFMLLNLEWARKYNLWDKAWKFFEEYSNPPYADQDILNAVIGQNYRDNIEYWKPEYNFFCALMIFKFITKKNGYYSHKEIENAYSHPKIFHYAGPQKPWNYYMCRNYKLWWKYLLESPFKDMKEFHLPLWRFIKKII